MSKIKKFKEKQNYYIVAKNDNTKVYLHNEGGYNCIVTDSNDNIIVNLMSWGYQEPSGIELNRYE